jgi:hypothetical protein
LIVIRAVVLQNRSWPYRLGNPRETDHEARRDGRMRKHDEAARFS